MLARRGLIAAVLLSLGVLIFLLTSNNSTVTQLRVPERLAKPWAQLKGAVWEPAKARIVDDVIAPAVAIIEGDEESVADDEGDVVLAIDEPEVCPDPLAVSAPARPSSPDEPEICEPMPSRKSDPFTLSLCRKPGRTCNEGSVVITRRTAATCARLESSFWPSRDLEEAAKIKREWGPDAFEIQFDGPERLVLVRPEYQGDCTYRYPFQLHNAGPFTVQIYWVYTVSFFPQCLPFFATTFPLTSCPL
jgi:hypothetical protein